MKRQSNKRNGKRVGEERSVIRAAGYVRCSDEGQSVSDFNTLDNQKNFISRHVAYLSDSSDKPWDLVDFYVDDGFSAKNTDRPNFQRLLVDIQAGEVDAVVVYKLDRITRSLSDFVQMDEMFAEWNVVLVSVKEKLDTSTPMGKAMRNIALIFAELERETNAERTRDKMQAEAKMGRWTGGVIPFGYRIVERRLVPNPDEAPIIDLMFRKWAETRSSARVRDHLNTLGYCTGVRAWKGGTRGGGAFSI